MKHNINCSEYHKKYKEAHKECEKLADIEHSKKHYSKHKDEYKQKRETIKQSVFNLLGNECIKCGNTDKRVLQLDHINGGGSKWRKDGHTGDNHYKKLLELPNIKEEIQVLCSNCNWIKKRENKEI